MANSDKRIIYTDDEGNCCIIIPSDNTSLTIEQIKAKDVPEGKTSYIVNKSDIPTDRTFRNAWTYSE
tara:strand:+ start:24129 stop:24329 length:201 start_codon:yes stop_codon:yes gene_type:complete